MYNTEREFLLEISRHVLDIWLSLLLATSVYTIAYLLGASNYQPTSGSHISVRVHLSGCFTPLLLSGSVWVDASGGSFPVRNDC